MCGLPSSCWPSSGPRETGCARTARHRWTPTCWRSCVGGWRGDSLANGLCPGCWRWRAGPGRPGARAGTRWDGSRCVGQESPPCFWSGRSGLSRSQPAACRAGRLVPQQLRRLATPARNSRRVDRLADESEESLAEAEEAESEKPIRWAIQNPPSTIRLRCRTGCGSRCTRRIPTSGSSGSLRTPPEGAECGGPRHHRGPGSPARPPGQSARSRRTRGTVARSARPRACGPRSSQSSTRTPATWSRP